MPRFEPPTIVESSPAVRQTPSSSAPFAFPSHPQEVPCGEEFLEENTGQSCGLVTLVTGVMIAAVVCANLQQYTATIPSASQGAYSKTFAEPGVENGAEGVGNQPGQPVPTNLQISKTYTFVLSKEAQVLCFQGKLFPDMSAVLSQLAIEVSSEVEMEIFVGSKDSSFRVLISNSTSYSQLLEDLTSRQHSLWTRTLLKDFWRAVDRQIYHNDGCRYIKAFSPYDKTCVAIRAKGQATDDKTFQIKTRQKLEPQLLMWLSAGIGLITIAPTLSSSLTFTYFSGMSLSMALGVCLVAVFATSRMGRGTFRVGIIAATITGYIASLVKLTQDFLGTLWQDYWEWVVGYFVFFALAGFLFTHYHIRKAAREKVTMEFTQDVIRWAMQATGFVLLYNSFYSTTASLTWSLAVLGVRIVPRSMTAWISGLWLSTRPAPHPEKNYRYGDRYLSQEQYRLQGEMATEKEMASLCKSPGFHQWVQRNAARIHLSPVDLADGSGSDTDE